jgi:hypothetical protein
VFSKEHWSDTILAYGVAKSPGFGTLPKVHVVLEISSTRGSHRQKGFGIPDLAQNFRELTVRTSHSVELVSLARPITCNCELGRRKLPVLVEDTMPKPKEWDGPEDLVRDLKRYKWQTWFKRERAKEVESDLPAIVKVAVESNTFRAFQNLPQKPSETFRDWANQALHGHFRSRLLTVRSQKQYDAWLSGLVRDLRKHWKKKMKRTIPYGPSWKLPNLLVKRLCLYRELPAQAIDRIIWFLHVPLDKYTILAVKNCVSSFPDPGAIGKVPTGATMSFVKNRRMYNAFQSGIKELTWKAKVPPIALDCLAWDKHHK